MLNLHNPEDILGSKVMTANVFREDIESCLAAGNERPYRQAHQP